MTGDTQRTMGYPGQTLEQRPLQQIPNPLMLLGQQQGPGGQTQPPTTPQQMMMMLMQQQQDQKPVRLPLQQGMFNPRSVLNPDVQRMPMQQSGNLPVMVNLQGSGSIPPSPDKPRMPMAAGLPLGNNGRKMGFPDGGQNQSGSPLGEGSSSAPLPDVPELSAAPGAQSSMASHVLLSQNQLMMSGSKPGASSSLVQGASPQQQHSNTMSGPHGHHFQNVQTPSQSSRPKTPNRASPRPYYPQTPNNRPPSTEPSEISLSPERLNASIAGLFPPQINIPLPPRPTLNRGFDQQGLNPTTLKAIGQAPPGLAVNNQPSFGPHMNKMDNGTGKQSNTGGNKRASPSNSRRSSPASSRKTTPSPGRQNSKATKLGLGAQQSPGLLHSMEMQRNLLGGHTSFQSPALGPAVGQYPSPCLPASSNSADDIRQSPTTMQESSDTQGMQSGGKEQGTFDVKTVHQHMKMPSPEQSAKVDPHLMDSSKSLVAEESKTLISPAMRDAPTSLSQLLDHSSVPRPQLSNSPLPSICTVPQPHFSGAPQPHFSSARQPHLPGAQQPHLPGVQQSRLSSPPPPQNANAPLITANSSVPLRERSPQQTSTEEPKMPELTAQLCDNLNKESTSGFYQSQDTEPFTSQGRPDAADPSTSVSMNLPATALKRMGGPTSTSNSLPPNQITVFVTSNPITPSANVSVPMSTAHLQPTLVPTMVTLPNVRNKVIVTEGQQTVQPSSQAQFITPVFFNSSSIIQVMKGSPQGNMPTPAMSPNANLMSPSVAVVGPLHISQNIQFSSGQSSSAASTSNTPSTSSNHSLLFNQVQATTHPTSSTPAIPTPPAHARESGSDEASLQMRMPTDQGSPTASHPAASPAPDNSPGSSASSRKTSAASSKVDKTGQHLFPKECTKLSEGAGEQQPAADQERSETAGTENGGSDSSLQPPNQATSETGGISTVSLDPTCSLVGPLPAVNASVSTGHSSPGGKESLGDLAGASKEGNPTEPPAASALSSIQEEGLSTDKERNPEKSDTNPLDSIESDLPEKPRPPSRRNSKIEGSPAPQETSEGGQRKRSARPSSASNSAKESAATGASPAQPKRRKSK